MLNWSVAELRDKWLHTLFGVKNVIMMLVAIYFCHCICWKVSIHQLSDVCTTGVGHVNISWCATAQQLLGDGQSYISLRLYLSFRRTLPIYFKDFALGGQVCNLPNYQRSPRKRKSINLAYGCLWLLMIAYWAGYKPALPVTSPHTSCLLYIMSLWLLLYFQLARHQAREKEVSLTS